MSRTAPIALMMIVVEFATVIFAGMRLLAERMKARAVLFERRGLSLPLINLDQQEHSAKR
jgi:hypothetical protein